MIGVETIIAVMGQLISLIKSRKEHKEDVFSTFVEPLYVETEKVISDYLKMYQNARDAIRQGQNNRNAFLNAWIESDIELKRLFVTAKEEFTAMVSDHPEQLEYLAKAGTWELSQDFIFEEFRRRLKENFDKDRQNMYHVRMKVIEVANVYSNSNLSADIKKFANAISDIFNVTNKASLRLRDLTKPRSVDMSDMLEDINVSDPEILEYIEQTEKEIRENWEEAIRQYAQLRIKSGSVQNFGPVALA